MSSAVGPRCGARTLTVPNAFYLCKLEKRFTLQVVV